jgi:hypothetical protein
MSACEKCWADASGFYGSQVTRYMDNIQKHNCTPEEQAGPKATSCWACRRDTGHQYTGMCMNCGADTKHPTYENKP